MDSKYADLDTANEIPIFIQQGAGLPAGAAGLRFPVDEKDRIWAVPSFLVNPVTGVPYAPTPLADQTIPAASFNVNSYELVGMDNTANLTTAFAGVITTFLKRGEQNVGSVSAANTANTFYVDLRNLHNNASIYMVATGTVPTATMTVSVSVDATNWVVVDSFVTAITTLVNYDISHPATTIALNPLSFRFWRIVVGAAGSGNVTTVIMGIK
jgi:hypothetical protein